jgi:hypothetical protein
MAQRQPGDARPAVDVDQDPAVGHLVVSSL